MVWAQGFSGLGLEFSIYNLSELYVAYFPRGILAFSQLETTKLAIPPNQGSRLYEAAVKELKLSSYNRETLLLHTHIWYLKFSSLTGTWFRMPMAAFTPCMSCRVFLMRPTQLQPAAIIIPGIMLQVWDLRS